MFKQPAYLYNNTQYLYTDLVAIDVGYRKVYARELKLHKGIDNKIELKLLNGDQKRLDVAGSTLYWQLLDRDTAELKLQKSYAVTPYDNSTVVLTVTEDDLNFINSGFYQYSTHLINANGQQTILYGDSQYGVSTPVEVVSNSFPQIYPSVEITTFINSGQPADTTLYTSAINARPEVNSKDGLHTVSINSSDFSGRIVIEGTLQNSINNIVWAEVDSITISNEPLVYKTFVGVYSWLRFHIVKDAGNTGTVDKIIYRS
jgi:hypothetical protein